MTTIITIERQGDGWTAVRRMPSGIVETITCGRFATEHAVARALGNMKAAGMLGPHECWNVVK
jgi:hypothetical protein